MTPVSLQNHPRTRGTSGILRVRNRTARESPAHAWKLYKTDKCNSFEAYCGQEHKFKMDVRDAKRTTDLSEFRCFFYLKNLGNFEKLSQILPLILGIKLGHFKEVDSLTTGHQIAIFEKLFESDNKITAQIVADTVKNFTGDYDKTSLVKPVLIIF